MEIEEYPPKFRGGDLKKDSIKRKKCLGFFFWEGETCTNFLNSVKEKEEPVVKEFFEITKYY